MAKVLVTGGAGFIGSVLCAHLLEAGHAVTVLETMVHRVPSLLHLAGRERFSFVLGDARDERSPRDRRRELEHGAQTSDKSGRAWRDTRNGRKVSTITANSSVRVLPMEASVHTGWGPWARPSGWRVIDPLLMPLRLMNSPST